MTINNEDWEYLKELYGIIELPRERFVINTGGDSKNIRLISEGV